MAKEKTQREVKILLAALTGQALLAVLLAWQTLPLLRDLHYTSDTYRNTVAAPYFFSCVVLYLIIFVILLRIYTTSRSAGTTPGDTPREVAAARRSSLAVWSSAQIRWYIISVITITIVVLFLTTPLLSNDAYTYTTVAREFANQQVNPLFNTMATTDPLIAFSQPEWILHASPYGPTWHYVAAIAIKISGSYIVTNFLAIKVLVALAGLAVLYLFYRITKITKPAWATTATVLLAVNPLFLWAIFSDAHNEALLLALVLATMYCLLRRKFFMASVFLALAIGTKVIAILLLPLFLVALWKATQKPRAVVAASFTILTVLIALYLPLWEGLNTFSGLITQGTLQRGLGLYTNYFAALFLPAIAGSDVANSRAIITLAITGIGAVITILLSILFARVLLQPHQKQSRFIEFSALILLTIPFFALSTTFAWYSLWALMPLLTFPRYRLLVLALTILACISYYTGTLLALPLAIFVLWAYFIPKVTKKSFGLLTGFPT